MRDVSDTLLRNRVMEESNRRDTMDRADRQAGFDETKRHNLELEKNYKLGLTFKKLAEFKNEFRAAVGNIAQGVAQDPNMADAVSQYFAGVIEEQDDDIRESLKKDPSIRAVLDGKVNWEQLAQTAQKSQLVEPKTMDVVAPDGTTKRLVYNPKTGSSREVGDRPLEGSTTTSRETIDPQTGDKITTSEKKPYRLGTGEDNKGAAAKESPSDKATLKRQAQQAIRQGKDPSSVAKRYKELTGEELL
jgi:hypothetical protein